jgi:long-chain acyl-CoA synthetase
MRLALPPDPILDAFAAHVASRRGDDPIALSPLRHWSARELDRAAGQLAVRVAEEALAPGRLVGLAAPAGPAFLAGYLALRRLGLVPVLCDSSEPTPDRTAALDRLGVAAFLWSPTGWPDATGAWVVSRRAPERETWLAPEIGAIKLSSGSTGLPRGVAVRAEALAADDAQLATSMGLRAEDRCLAVAPLSHSYGFSSLLLPALMRGSVLVFAEERSPFAALAAGRALGATFFPTVPAFLTPFVRLSAAPAWPESVRLTIAAGAPLPPETAALFRRRHGFPVHVFYGASEAGGITYDRAGDAAERGTVGTPVDGVEIALDEESGRFLVRSAAVAEGYLPEPSADLGAGSFRTGDLGAWVGGELRLLGRADGVLIVRGKNVNPREIELAIADLPGVDEVCVLGVDGPDGPASMLRAVVAAPGGGVDYQGVVAHCRHRLAEFKVPRSVLVVPELPRNARGKVDRAALVALVDQAPSPAR